LIFTCLSGRKVDYLNPKNIHLEDVALGLSAQPRFAGQTLYPYSVAQHCLLVHRLYPSIYSLLHDAQEAFLGDITTPAKEAMRALGSKAYDELESRLYKAICQSVGVDPNIKPREVKEADMEAFRIERGVLQGGKQPGKYRDIFILPYGGDEWLEEVGVLRGN